MISNYSIITGEGYSHHGAFVELTNEVRTLMAHGWQPQGGAFYCGVQTIKGYTTHVYAQTIVKHAAAPVASEAQP